MKEPRAEPLPDFDMYAVLGIPHDAPANVVVAAHRGLIRRSHPDLSSDPGSSERAKRLNVARDWLLDPLRRARYDEARPWIAPVAAGPSGTRVPVRAGGWAWQARLELFVARCADLTPAEGRRLSGMTGSTGAAGDRTAATLDRATRMLRARGREALVVLSIGSVLAALPESRMRLDPDLARILRRTAIGFAVSDLAPLDAEGLLSTWRIAIEKPDARTDRRRARLRRTRAILGRLAIRVGAAVLAILVVLGLLELARVALGQLAIAARL